MTGKKKERVGILGGTFDPVHNGHIAIALSAREKFRLDRVLFIPANLSPHKRAQTPSPTERRLEMLRLALRPYPGFAVSLVELRRAGVSYTVDTLERLRAEFPETEFFLIMGLDTFKGLGAWKGPRRLTSLCHLLVGTRPGHELKNPEEALEEISGATYSLGAPARGPAETIELQNLETGMRAFFFELVPKDISSSEIRRRVRDGLEVKNMLPPEVEHYIIEHQLYRTRPHPIV
ncbi:MAG: nicotinate (nicotinamide) nucleotide adenylyltransferase [Nitrospinae bacterium]|nr:nicotinate (nicotinamide) nucleotide adenylyltransferase [Nitrospinota bacterium]